MFKLLYAGCLVAIVLGSALRFTLIAQAMAEAKVLPKSWRRWLYGLNHPSQ